MKKIKRADKIREYMKQLSKKYNIYVDIQGTTVNITTIRKYTNVVILHVKIDHIIIYDSTIQISGDKALISIGKDSGHIEVII